MTARPLGRVLLASFSDGARPSRGRGMSNLNYLFGISAPDCEGDNHG